MMGIEQELTRSKESAFPLYSLGTFYTSVVSPPQRKYLFIKAFIECHRYQHIDAMSHGKQYVSIEKDDFQVRNS